MSREGREIDGPEDMTPGSKPYFIMAAAQSLLLNAQVGIEIAGVSTSAFVHTTRQIWKANGFNFSDTDIREVHMRLKRLVNAMAAKNLLPQVNPAGSILRGQ